MKAVTYWNLRLISLCRDYFMTTKCLSASGQVLTSPLQRPQFASGLQSSPRMWIPNTNSDVGFPSYNLAWSCSNLKFFIIYYPGFQNVAQVPQMRSSTRLSGVPTKLSTSLSLPVTQPKDLDLLASITVSYLETKQNKPVSYLKP